MHLLTLGEGITVRKMIEIKARPEDRINLFMILLFALPIHYSFTRIKYFRIYLVCEQPLTGKFEGIRCFELLKTLKHFIVIYYCQTHTTAVRMDINAAII